MGRGTAPYNYQPQFIDTLTLLNLWILYTIKTFASLVLLNGSLSFASPVLGFSSFSPSSKVTTPSPRMIHHYHSHRSRCLHHHVSQACSPQARRPTSSPSHPTLCSLLCSPMLLPGMWVSFISVLLATVKALFRSLPLPHLALRHKGHKALFEKKQIATFKILLLCVGTSSLCRVLETASWSSSHQNGRISRTMM